MIKHFNQLNYLVSGHFPIVLRRTWLFVLFPLLFGAHSASAQKKFDFVFNRGEKKEKKEYTIQSCFEVNGNEIPGKKDGIRNASYSIKLRELEGETVKISAKFKLTHAKNFRPYFNKSSARFKFSTGTIPKIKVIKRGGKNGTMYYGSYESNKFSLCEENEELTFEIELAVSSLPDKIEFIITPNHFKGNDECDETKALDDNGAETSTLILTIEQDLKESPQPETADLPSVGGDDVPENLTVPSKSDARNPETAPLNGDGNTQPKSNENPAVDSRPDYQREYDLLTKRSATQAHVNYVLNYGDKKEAASLVKKVKEVIEESIKISQAKEEEEHRVSYRIEGLVKSSLMGKPKVVDRNGNQVSIDVEIEWNDETLVASLSRSDFVNSEGYFLIVGVEGLWEEALEKDPRNNLINSWIIQISKSGVLRCIEKIIKEKTDTLELHLYGFTGSQNDKYIIGIVDTLQNAPLNFANFSFPGSSELTVIQTGNKVSITSNHDGSSETFKLDEGRYSVILSEEKDTTNQHRIHRISVGPPSYWLLIAISSGLLALFLLGYLFNRNKLRRQRIELIQRSKQVELIDQGGNPSGMVIKKRPEANRITGEITETETRIASNPYFEMIITDWFADSSVTKVFLAKRFIQKLHSFVSEENDIRSFQGGVIPEIGGFILGKFEDTGEGIAVYFERFVDIEPASNGLYQIEFGSDAWLKLDNARDLYKEDGYELMGWFHTHPGHGLFLSKPDLNIHTNLFKRSFQIAMVIDPISKNTDYWEMALFSWKTNLADVNNSNNALRSWQNWDAIVNWLRMNP